MSYANNAEIEAVVRAFESCAFSPVEFNHRAHTTVALWYLAHHPAEEARALMRDGLQRFTRHHGASGYNETITLFWMKLLGHGLARTDRNVPLHEQINALIVRWGSMRFLFVHYSREVAFSSAAQNAWVEPDLL